MLDVRASARDGPVAQRLEQGTLNSSLTNCADFHSFAWRVFHRQIRTTYFAWRFAELRSFAAKISSIVESDREFSGRFFLARARGTV